MRMAGCAHGLSLKTFVASASLVLAFFVAAPLAHAATTVTAATFPNTGSVEWTTAGSPYLVQEVLNKRYGSFTIDPGVIVKFAPGTRLSTHADVVTTIVGTAESPIYFTSLKDDSVGGDSNLDADATTPSPGDWGYASFGNGSWNRNMHLEYLKVRYGGDTAVNSTMGIHYPALLISYSWYTGAPGENYTLTNLEVAHSAGDGLYLAVGQNNSVVLSHSSLHDNAAYGAFRHYTVNIYGQLATGGLDAREVWWGDPTGPYHASLNPTGLGNPVDPTVSTIGASVTFVPWLTHNPLADAPVYQDCCSSVLFLPGIMGTRLYSPTQKLWEPANESDVQELYMDLNGLSIRNDITAPEVIETYDGPGPLNLDLYSSFFADLEAKVTNGTIEAFVAYPYDWRLSIPSILADGELESTLRALAEASHTGKVTVVAHSNGGLLAKALINELGPDAASLVDQIVLVGVPQLGTPQAIGALMHGYDSGIPTQYSEARARDFAQNAPFAYHLLPHHDYFAFSGGTISTPLALFEAGEVTQRFIDAYGPTIDTKAELDRFVSGDEGRPAPTFYDLKNPAVGNGALRALADQYVAPIDSHWQAPQGVIVHQIAGVGEQTLTGITYKDGLVSCANWGSGQSSTPQCLEYFTGIMYTPETAIDGDGTVVTPSALAIGQSEQIKRWWVDLKEFNADTLEIFSGIRFLRTKHADILKIPNVRTLILDEIIGSTTLQYTYVSTEPPAIEAEDRLVFTLHSPLDMWVADSLGNVVSSSTVSIPGASYNRYGEVQVVTVPQGSPVSLNMRGLELGIFTLEVEEYVGGTRSSRTAFAGVPTTETTSVSLELPTATVAQSGALEVDYQSDGAPDLVLEPKLNEVVTPDVMPPTTVAVLSGVAGTGGWYRSSVAVTLTALDEGSGVVETWYAVDGSAFVQGATTTVSGDGTHTLRFYSVDAQGNAEGEKSEEIRIDSVAPEVILSGSVNSKDLSVVGADAQSSVVVTAVGTSTTLTDEAGNTTVLGFKKTYTGLRLTYARLESIRYNDGPAVALPSSFAFLWDKTGMLTSQTIVADSQFIVQALYDKKKNKTSVVVLKKNVPIKVTTLPGLAPIKLTTSQGQVTYSW